MGYEPKPADITDIELPKELLDLMEILAENTHEMWSEARIRSGWKYGTERNDQLKETPNLVPYDELPELEKDFDRILSLSILKLIIKLGYEIKKKDM